MNDDRKGNYRRDEGGPRRPRGGGGPRNRPASGGDSSPWENREPRPRRDESEAAKKVAPRRKLPGEQWLEPVCGLHAVGSLFHCKPFIVERLFFDSETAPMLGELCKFLAKEKKAYRQVDYDELCRVSGTRHHGGVVAIARRRPLEKATPKTAEFWAKEGHPLLVLDGVGNTHNFGGLARTAAFFGIEKLLIAESRRQALPSESAYRVARGGMDMLDLRLVDNVPSFLKGIQKTYFTIGLDIEGQPLPDFLALCPEEKLDCPVAIVVGNEETGLGEGTREVCDVLVGIPGGGALDRLNVVAEASLLIQKYLVEG